MGLHEQMLRRDWERHEKNKLAVQEPQTGIEATLDALARHDEQTLAKNAVAAIDTWLETSEDDLDDDEGMGDRLMALFIGIADADKDGEIDDDEQEVIDEAREIAVDYLLQYGVDESDVEQLLNDWDNDCAERVQELMGSTMDSLPASNDDGMDHAEKFIFDSLGYDQPTLDAVYKKKMAIRGGKKVKVNKRMSGRVKLSPKRKLAIRKMLRKSHTGGAKRKRARSMKMRKKMIAA